MELKISATRRAKIQPDMIGLFFEDINYAADGGLYAEMIENRSFEFVRAGGDAKDYYFEYDGLYGWNPFPADAAITLRTVEGSPLSEENPHYLRAVVHRADVGFCNQGYSGIALKQGMDYHITFFARCVSYHGSFRAEISKNGKCYASTEISCEDHTEETYNYFRKYHLTLHANESVTGAVFALILTEPGTIEFDFISMFPADAVAGIFRKDLFDALNDLKPGFLRFPGGCIVEGNTLSNRYRYKDSLTEAWNRKNNWNRWAVHENSNENDFCGKYSHYNQTLGLGYYEYFLLCELIGAKALPVMNVGFACQYQSTEQVAMDSPEFKQFVQDALDLIEFANGGTDTKWGAVREKMGHPEPFGLTLLGIGNEQWQTERADFFERYTAFEQAIHDQYPSIRLIGSAGPDITSARYTAAWDFYHKNADKENFVYAVDEHYYVKPEWLYEHVNFYDDYPRNVKVFSGEYAAHPKSGMNRPDANTVEGALAEAAFLTNLERNADVVVMASYAPLFARLDYTQWSPDMIWFDETKVYPTASYYVQQLYSCNMGDVTLDTKEQEKEAAKEGLYYSVSYCEKEDKVIVKIVNANGEAKPLRLLPDKEFLSHSHYHAKALTAAVDCQTEMAQSGMGTQSRLLPEKASISDFEGSVTEEIILPPKSFTVLRF
ncbi:MAG: alpha-L-arabinofuranosidase [Lachnospiraceae bacterium]|nr:alpha-L-arabinofuranosidase [Lachnospiraceae bacterium]